MTDDLLPIDYVVVTAENIASKLHGEYIRLVTKYRLSSQTERWCAGIALGPNAYLSFKHWCASSQRLLLSPLGEFEMRFHNIPLFVCGCPRIIFLFKDQFYWVGIEEAKNYMDKNSMDC